MLLHQILIQQRLSQPFPQKHLVVVHRADNSDVTIEALGHNPQDAADRVHRNTRAYGYADAICVTPAPEESAPDRGDGR